MPIKQYKGNKEFTLVDFKAEQKDGKVIISGYANTKGVADRYGDIPTPFGRSYVYELQEYLRNPVVLLDHNAEVKNLAGKCNEIREDEKGLFFKAEITESTLPIMEHVRTLIREDILKTVSIGGIWTYEDMDNPAHLTLAKIFEISLVTIPADTYATFTQVKDDTKQAEPAEVKEPDYSALNKKMTIFEMEQKLKNFEVQNQKPAQGKEQ